MSTQENEDYIFKMTLTCTIPLLVLLYLKVCSSVHWLDRRNDTSYEQRLRMYYKHSQTGFFIEVLNAVLSIMSSCLYVVETYEIKHPAALCISLSSDLFFTSHYFFAWFLSRSKRRYPLTVQALVDEVTLIPSFIAWSQGDYYANTVGIFRTYRLVKILRVAKVARILRSSRVVKEYLDAVNFQIFNSMMQLIFGTVIIAGVVQAVERRLSDEDWECSESSDPECYHSEYSFSFVDSLYFTVVTLSTVGYGDISPPGQLGRLLVVFFIGLVIFWIPKATAKVIELRQLKPKHTHYIRASRFVTVCADPDAGPQVKTFINTLFHPDNGLDTPHAGILVPWPHHPDDIYKSILLNHGEERITFLRGDLQGRSNYEIAKVQNAKAVFIITAHSTDYKELDGRTILRVLTCQQVAPNVPIFARVIQRKTKDLLLAIGVQESNIICQEEIQSLQLTCGILCHGWSTFLSNLVTFEGFMKVNKDKSMEYYWEGVAKEIYVFKYLGDAFKNWFFTDAALLIYKEYNLTLLGIYRTEKGTGTDSVTNKVFFAPGKNFTIKDGDKGLMICDDRDALHKISKPGEVSRWTKASVSRNVRRLSLEIANHLSLGGEEKSEDEKKGISDEKKAPADNNAPTPQGPRTSRKSSSCGEKLQPFLEEGNVLVVVTNTLSTTLAPIIDEISYQRKQGMTNISEVSIVCSDLKGSEEDYLEPLSEWMPVCDNLKVQIFAAETTYTVLKEAGLTRASVLLFMANPSAKDFLKADLQIIVKVLNLLPYLQLQGFDGRLLTELHTPDLIDQVSLVHDILYTIHHEQAATVTGKIPLESTSNIREIIKASGENTRKAMKAIQRINSVKELVEMDVPNIFNESLSEEKQAVEAFASGDVIINDLPETMLCHSFLNPEMGEVVRQMHGGHQENSKAKIVQLYIPDSFWKCSNKEECTYGNLYCYLLERFDAVMVGIYRRNAKDMPLVLAAPEADCMLDEKDTIYVFANQEFICSNSASQYQRDTETKDEDISRGQNYIADINALSAYSKRRAQHKAKQHLTAIDTLAEEESVLTRMEDKLSEIVESINSIGSRIDKLELKDSALQKKKERR